MSASLVETGARIEIIVQKSVVQVVSDDYVLIEDYKTLLKGDKGDQGDPGLADMDAKVDSIFDGIFYLDGQNQLTSAIVLTAQMPYACYIVGIGASMQTQRVSGTIDFVVTKNGTPITGTGLNIQLNASYPLDRVATVAHRTAGYEFNANDKLRVAVTSNSWSPVPNVGSIYVVIKNT